MHCILSEGEVNQAFLAAPPLISKQIHNIEIRTPNWLTDMYDLEPFPLGQGTSLQQLYMRGEMPQVERGFDKWKKLSDNSGCNPCAGPDCSYNWTQFGGTGIERKMMELMARDFRSPSYCVKEIQNTAHFEQIIGYIVQNLSAQVRFFKEINIGFNYFTGLLKKYVVDSGGPKPNTQNPYVYRPPGTARLSMLNMELLEYFYEFMRFIPEAVPYDTVNGGPIFALEASPQLLSRLYRDDPSLRQDVRFSSLVNDMVTKYNFVSTIRGMYIPCPILYPRRFRIVSANWVEVLPFVNGIPMEAGSYTGVNPLYMDPGHATHEEVSIHGKHPFKVFHMTTAQSVGGGTSFGPESSFMNTWEWINIKTDADPMRRVGYFATNATIGLAPQWSEAMFGILVERPKVGLTAMWLPEPTCPPTPIECTNTVPDVGCPCPLILSYSANPITPGTFFINLAVPTTAVATDVLQFGVDSGGYLDGTVDAVSTDGLAVEVTFAGDVDLATCDRFTSLFCDNTLGCFATVLAYEINCTDSTRLDLSLSNPIKAVTAADVVTLTYGDGTIVSATVVSIDMLTNKWIVDVGATAVCDQIGGVVSICVPTATDATCPSCGGVTFTQCET